MECPVLTDGWHHLHRLHLAVTILEEEQLAIDSMCGCHEHSQHKHEAQRVIGLEIARGAQGASPVAPGKSGFYARG